MAERDIKLGSRLTKIYTHPVIFSHFRGESTRRSVSANVFLFGTDNQRVDSQSKLQMLKLFSGRHIEGPPC